MLLQFGSKTLHTDNFDRLLFKTEYITASKSVRFDLSFVANSFNVTNVLFGYTGYGVNRAVHMCNAPENMNPENRDRLIKFLSNQMDRLLGYRREYREGKFQ